MTPWTSARGRLDIAIHQAGENGLHPCRAQMFRAVTDIFGMIERTSPRREERIVTDSQQPEAFVLGDGYRRQILGDEYVDRTNNAADPRLAMWRKFATEVAWGHFWPRAGLELRTRSMLTLAALTALGEQRELSRHVRGALRLGLTPEEIAEIFIHVACYAGFPKADGSFEILEQIMAEETG
jgi:alkylhydroperoxidase/carboxymuconolactone decarboxylase family protein YurZ